MIYCLDTNVIIALMRNRSEVIERLRWHGIAFEELTEARAVTVEQLRLVEGSQLVVLSI